jgi:hypothetical protein
LASAPAATVRAIGVASDDASSDDVIAVASCDRIAVVLVDDHHPLHLLLRSD